MSANTVRFHRVLRASPEKVYRAFLDPDAMARWLPPKFDNPNLIGQMQTSITLKAVSCGTELNIVQEGIPEVIPTDACYLGWQQSLVFLAALVEPEIPD